MTTRRASWGETYLGVLSGIDDALDYEYLNEVIEEADEGGPMNELPDVDHGALELEARLRTTPGAPPRTPEEIEAITEEYYRHRMDGGAVGAVSDQDVENALRRLVAAGAAKHRARRWGLAKRVAEVIADLRPGLDGDERATAAELVLGTSGFYEHNGPSTTMTDRVVVALMELKGQGIEL